MMRPDYTRIIPLITSKVSSKPKRVNFMKSDATTDFCTIGFASAKDFADAMKEFGDVQEALEVCRDERLEILDPVVRERLATVRKRQQKLAPLNAHLRRPSNGFKIASSDLFRGA